MEKPMARKLVKIIALANGEEFTPDMYVMGASVRGNASLSQWDHVKSEAQRAPALFRQVFEDELEEETGEKTYGKEELDSMSMKELIAIAKDRAVKYAGVSKIDLVGAILKSQD